MRSEHAGGICLRCTTRSAKILPLEPPPMRIASWYLVAVTCCLACRAEAPPPAQSRPLAVTDSLQGLTGPQRDSLHHLSEGDEFIPLVWLQSLENPATGRLFLDDVERFGMLPDPASVEGLPLGLSANAPRDVGLYSGRMVGFSCSACHTGHLTYRGADFLIEGGSGTVDAEGFEHELISALDSLKDARRFAAFFERVRARREDGDTIERPNLAELLELFPKLKARMASFSAVRTLLAQTDRTASGYGRIDAFGTGRNLLYPESAIPLDAPVRYPVIYDAYRHKWLHWDANTNSIMERNIGQAIAAGAIIDAKTKRSTLLPLNLYALEGLAARIVPPRWPAAQLGAIDTTLAASGRAVYMQHCERCHALRASGPTERDTLLNWKDVGTDPRRATSAAVPLKGGGQYPVVAGELLREMKDTAFRQSGISAAQQAVIEGNRANSVWRVTESYAARPLTGLWSHPPYLHNGSVPTLDDLLHPPSQRPQTFLLGHHEFDPQRVGLAATGPMRGPPFTFDTRKRGNSNGGHLWGTDLSDAQRKQLLEYLKTL